MTDEDSPVIRSMARIGSVCLLVMGGCGATHEEPPLCRNAWVEVRIPGDLSPADGKGRVWHSSAWTGTGVLTWGGTQNVPRGVVFEPPASFSAVPDEGSPEPLFNDGVVWASDRALIFGAPPSTYSSGSERWSSLAVPERVERVLAGVWTGSHALVAARVGGVDVLVVEYFRVDLDTGEWMPLPADGAPPSEGFRPIAWTGSELFVWGGSGNTETTGRRFDPESGAWTFVASDGTPSPRQDHSVTASDDGIVVWGGNADEPGAPGTGAVYHPDRDAWTPTSEDGAPSARRQHRAVLAGERVIVFGGSGEEGPNAGGGVYDVKADFWSELTTQCGPRTRTGQTLTWTGQELVVWGGAECDEEGACDTIERVWLLSADTLSGALPPDDPDCECQQREGVAR